MSLSVSLKYKKLQNRLSELSVEDALAVIWAYSQFLQVGKNFIFPKDIQVALEYLQMQIPQQWIAEWDLELLAKEVIIHGTAVAKRGHTFRSWHTLFETVRVLRSLEGAIYKKYGSQETIQIELVRISHRQFVWQSNKPNSAVIARYYKIFNRQRINEICVQKLGLTVQEIYECGIACMGHYLTSPALRLPFRSEIDALPVETIEKFLSFVSLPIAQLRSRLQSVQRLDERYLYTCNLLRQFPLVRMRYQSNESLVCPIMTLLYWKFTSGLYYELVDVPAFGNEFGDGFQEYVGNVIAKACPTPMRHLPEDRYKLGHFEKRTVDWIVLDDKNSALFVECKTKRLTWKAKEALLDLTALEADIQEIASAVVQAYKSINDYLEGHYPQIKHEDSRKVFPAVVTLENWHIFGPLLIGKLETAVAAQFETSGLPLNFIEQMPYSVWTIADFEAGLQIMSKRGIADVIEGKVRDAESKNWDWHGYLIHRYRAMYPLGKLFDDEYDQITQPMIDARIKTDA